MNEKMGFLVFHGTRAPLPQILREGLVPWESEFLIDGLTPQETVDEIRRRGGEFDEAFLATLQVRKEWREHVEVAGVPLIYAAETREFVEAIDGNSFTALLAIDCGHPDCPRDFRQTEGVVVFFDPIPPQCLRVIE